MLNVDTNESSRLNWGCIEYGSSRSPEEPELGVVFRFCETEGKARSWLAVFIGEKIKVFVIWLLGRRCEAVDVGVVLECLLGGRIIDQVVKVRVPARAGTVSIYAEQSNTLCITSMSGRTRQGPRRTECTPYECFNLSYRKTTGGQ